jgi:hypothetical protein
MLAAYAFGMLVVTILTGGMCMRYCAVVALLLLVAGFVFGADVDGKWTTKMQGMDGNEMTLGYTFRADGNTLTGTTTGPDGKEIPIKNGKIDGNNISFAVTVDFGGQEMTMEYKGVVSPDQIKLTLDMMGQPMEMVLRKAQ